MGRRDVALIDPGPDVETHVRALVAWVEDAASIRILVTHRHSDHTGAVKALASATGAPVLGPPGVDGLSRPLEDGDVVETDEGPLVAVSTPGHSREHFCYLWPSRRALFAGDLLLGRGATTWVAEYPGCVADYLASLERLRALDLEVIYPAHGPPIEDPDATLDRFEHHRRERIREVEEALDRNPEASPRALLETIYGRNLPPHVEAAALRSLEALVDHVRGSASG